MILLSNIIKAEYVIFDGGNASSDIQANKAEHPEPKAISAMREDLYEIYNHREEIISEANENALRIINSARISAQEEIAKCKKKGYDEGYDSGVEEGRKRGYVEGYDAGEIRISEALHIQSEARMSELAEMLEKVEERKEEMISEYEDNLSKLAIEIAEKIIRQKIDSNDNVISGIIRGAIKDYKNAEWIKVYISERDDSKQIKADKDLIKELEGISKDVKFEVSDDLRQGSVIVEMPDGLVDASVDTQLKNFKEMVLNKDAN